MKLEDLVKLSTDEGKLLVNDHTTISVMKTFESCVAKLRRIGNWYEDQLLDLMDEEVGQFEFDAEGNHLTVYLR